MPNWTENNVTAKTEVLSKYLNEKGEFDFNKLVPMPEALEVEDGSSGQNGLTYLYYKASNQHSDEYNPERAEEINKVYRSLNPFFSDIASEKRYKEIVREFCNNPYSKDNKRSIETAEKYIENYKEYGACTWYQWCIKNWGCKWNASHICADEIGDGLMTVSFNTPWNLPEPIFEKMCKDNPEEPILFEHSDEDYNGNHFHTNEHGEFVYIETFDREFDSETFEYTNETEYESCVNNNLSNTFGIDINYKEITVNEVEIG